MRIALVLMMALLALPSQAAAEVVGVQDSGFSIKIGVDVAAAPAAVFKVLTEQVGAWWSSSHSFSGKASNLSIEAKPGGCFCEVLPNGGVRHMTVTHVMAPGTLVLNGGLGPLGTMAVTGAMEWTLEARGTGTHLQVVYNVGGYVPGGLEAIAAPVDGVLTEQVTRLRTFVETGKVQ